MATKEKTLFEKVRDFKTIKFDCSVAELQEHFPNANYNSLKEYNRRINREREEALENISNKFDPTEGTFRGLNKKEKNEETNIKQFKIDPSEIPSFQEFVNTEAFPPPVHRKTKEFIGILDYELEGYKIIEDNDEVCLLWPREHGKTWLVEWYIQYRMKYYAENFLYLSLTKIRFAVSRNIFQWAWRNDLLDSKNAIKNDKQDTYRSFTLNNGAKFEEHRFMSKDILGYHGWNIVIDDFVDKKWETYQAKQEEAKDYWDYTLSYIGMNKLVLVNTRKFEGDLLDYILDLHEDTMVVDVKTPYKRCKCETPNVNERGLHVYCETCKQESLLAPQIHTQKELTKKKEKNLFAWYAEMMQDPHPIQSTIFKNITYIFEPKTPYVRHYDIFYIYIDRATTTKKSSDYTGVIMGLRDKNTGVRIITHDHTDHINLEDLLVLVNNTLIDVKKKYAHISCHLVIETQGGGDDFISMIKTRKSFQTHGKTVPNRIADTALITPVHSTDNKQRRIQDRLYAPINNGSISFVSNLKQSELLKEIQTFPYCARFDAIDALALGDFEIQKLQVGPTDNLDDLLEVWQNYDHDKQEVLSFEPETDLVLGSDKFTSQHSKKRTVF